MRISGKYPISCLFRDSNFAPPGVPLQFNLFDPYDDDDDDDMMMVNIFQYSLTLVEALVLKRY